MFDHVSAPNRLKPRKKEFFGLIDETIPIPGFIGMLAHVGDTMEEAQGLQKRWKKMAPERRFRIVVLKENVPLRTLIEPRQHVAHTHGWNANPFRT